MTDQSHIISFLEDPASYDGTGQHVQRIDTHGALVFLVGDTVFKIKRAVAYPYMDFSTLDKRRRACQRELELNQSHAPDIYLGVVPVTRAENGALAIDGDGEPVEWAVKMRRFRQEDMLDAIADRGGVDVKLASKIADIVSNYHNQATRIETDTISDTLSQLVSGISNNLSESQGGPSKSDIASFKMSALDRISACERLLAARARTGFVRHCHGDLHLQNIVLLDGVPTLFDAIEFDDRIAQIDVFYDLAFLLADLDHRDLRTSANIILNRYLFRQNQALNIYALGLLPLYLGLRHAIRAMVAMDRSKHMNGREKEASTEQATSYFADALQCLDPVPARLIGVGGLSGSGKSTLARHLAPHVGASPGAFHLRSDLERKQLFKVEETTRLEPRYYTQEISDQVYAALYRKTEMALKVGHSVVVDAVFLKENERRKLGDIAQRLGVSFEGLWLDAPKNDLITRVEARSGDASDATAQVVDLQSTADPGVICWTRLDAGGSQKDTLDAARASIGL